MWADVMKNFDSYTLWKLPPLGTYHCSLKREDIRNHREFVCPNNPTMCLCGKPVYHHLSWYAFNGQLNDPTGKSPYILLRIISSFDIIFIFSFVQHAVQCSTKEPGLKKSTKHCQMPQPADTLTCASCAVALIMRI